jgi:hypothetical protein
MIEHGRGIGPNGRWCPNCKEYGFVRVKLTLTEDVWECLGCHHQATFDNPHVSGGVKALKIVGQVASIFWRK